MKSMTNSNGKERLLSTVTIEFTDEGTDRNLPHNLKSETKAVNNSNFAKISKREMTAYEMLQIDKANELKLMVFN